MKNRKKKIIDLITKGSKVQQAYNILNPNSKLRALDYMDYLTEYPASELEQ